MRADSSQSEPDPLDDAQRRVGVWRGDLGRACLFPPLSSGGALVVRPWLRFHIPLIEPDVRISRIRLSDKTSRRLSRATPSAVSGHHLELIGCPISRSFATSCVCLELRPLPSAGITRLRRYYEPLRHPSAPGLSLAGVRLVLSSLTTTRGASRVACAFLVYMLPPLPRCSGWASSSLIHPAVSAFPENVVGSACTSTFSRHAQRSLALRPAHSRGHLYVQILRRLGHFVTSMTAPVASGWSGCRVGLAPTGKRRLVTAHT